MTKQLSINTRGEGDILDVTDAVAEAVVSARARFVDKSVYLPNVFNVIIGELGEENR